MLLHKSAKLAADISKWIAAAILAALTLTMIAQVFFRYVLNSSLSWTDEFGAYFLAWGAFFGSVTVLFEGKHLAISALVDRLKPPASHIVKIAAYLFTLAFVAILILYGTPMMLKSLNIYAVTIRVSKAVIYSCVPLSSILMALVLLDIIVEECKELFIKEANE